MTDNDNVSIPEDHTPTLIELHEPIGGLPPLIQSDKDLELYCEALIRGNGPLAVDAERASGFRYRNQNYLIQIRREGSGTGLIDPIAVPDLTSLIAIANNEQWVLHAASQDLPALSDQGLRPLSLFDTELAGRLLGLPRVGLGTVVADLLGYHIAKEHSAADWSTRPLPIEWLRYAALDVEVLIELKDVMTSLLEASGKLAWAQEEFEHVRLAPPPPVRVDPWRRISHITTLRTPRQLAVARELWLARDQYAQRRDIAPGRTLTDRAIIAASQAMPRSVPELLNIREFSRRASRHRVADWHAAIQRALTMEESLLPKMRGPKTDAPPPPRNWPEKSPMAAERLSAARAIITTLSEEHNIPAENLLQPDALRRLCWQQPFATTAEDIDALLASRLVRPWQRELVVNLFAQAFHALQIAV